ncbi:hsp70 protein [Ditylenchus destructor]|nr:hsp70 protein [Ditylenchus destructor]
MIGRQFRDPFIQEQMKYWPFKLAEGKNGEVVVVLDFEGRKRMMNPEEIAAQIILKMRDMASDHFNNRPVTSAVIAIPTYFNEDLCNATCRAAKMAGVDIIELIPEPMAAALAYAEHTSKYTGYNLLVFDLGGGTFDVTIVTLVNDAINALKVDGDLNLGGRDFDNVLFNLCMVKIKETLGRPVDSNQKQKLRYKCEVMKRQLSTQSEIRFNSKELFTDLKNVPLVIKRESFEQESRHLVDRCIEITKNILNSTRLKPDDIQHILLVGGSSKIPIIRRKLVEMFGRDKIYPLDDAVAYGTAVRAAQIYEEIKRSNSNSVENIAHSASTSVRSAQMNSVGNVFQNDHHPGPSNFNLNRDLMSEKDNAQIMKLIEMNESLNEQLCRSQAKIDQLERESQFQKIEILNVREMQNDVKKANENLTERLYNLNCKLYTDNAKISELEAEREENAEKMSHLQRRLEALQAENTELVPSAKETERLTTEVSSLTKLFDAAQNEAKQFSDENSLLRAQISQCEEKVEESNAQKKKAEEESAALHDRIREANKLNENVVERLNTSLVKCSEELATAKEELVTEREKNADERVHFQLRLNALEAENTERVRCSKETERLRMEVDSLKDLLDAAKNEPKQLSDGNALLRKQVTKYNDQFKKSGDQRRKLGQKYDSLRDISYKAERDFGIKRERDYSTKLEQFEHSQQQVAYYRIALKQRESRIAELDENVKQSEHIRSCLSEELAKSNWEIQSTKAKLERQQLENEQCTSVWNQQRNADQTRIRILESKLARYKSIFSSAVNIAEELNETEPIFQGEPIGQPATSSEDEPRKRHSFDNDEEDKDLRDPIKKPYFSPIPPDDLSRLPTPSNCEAALRNHGENDTTLPLLQPPMPAHEDVALSDVGVNGEITAQVFRHLIIN